MFENLVNQFRKISRMATGSGLAIAVGATGIAMDARADSAAPTILHFSCSVTATVAQEKNGQPFDLDLTVYPAKQWVFQKAVPDNIHYFHRFYGGQTSHVEHGTPGTPFVDIENSVKVSDRKIKYSFTSDQAEYNIDMVLDRSENTLAGTWQKTLRHNEKTKSDEWKDVNLTGTCRPDAVVAPAPNTISNAHIETQALPPPAAAQAPTQLAPKALFTDNGNDGQKFPCITEDEQELELTAKECGAIIGARSLKPPSESAVSNDDIIQCMPQNASVGAESQPMPRSECVRQRGTVMSSHLGQ